MSHLPAQKRTSAALRKQKQRAKLRGGGRSKVEPWISGRTKELIQAFAARLGLDMKGVAELVLEAATPLYLGQINRRLDALLPLITRIREFEYYGVRPSRNAGLPVRISGASGPVILDPREYQDLIEKVAPTIAELERFGIKKDWISNLVPPRKHPALPRPGPAI